MIVLTNKTNEHVIIKSEDHLLEIEEKLAKITHPTESKNIKYFKTKAVDLSKELCLIISKKE